MLDKMKQLMEMRKQAEQIKKQLDALSVEVNDIKGIKIVINGSSNFQSIEIDESMIEKEKKKKLEADLLHSINGAIAQSQRVAAQKMKDVMPGFPGM